MTGSRRYSWFQFPYCKRCKWHMTWSGRFRTGMVNAFGWLFVAGGILGGVALGLSGEGGDRQGNAIVFTILGATTGYLLCMLLVMLVGLLIAPSRRECTCRGAAVRLRRGDGVWHFRFTNPQFEDVFRAINKGFEPIVPAALRRR